MTTNLTVTVASSNSSIYPQVVYSLRISCGSDPDVSSWQEEDLRDCCSVYSFTPFKERVTLNQGARSPCTAFPLTTFVRKGSLQGRGVETSSSCKATRRCLPRTGRKNSHCPKAGVGCGHRGGMGVSQPPSTWTPKCLRLHSSQTFPPQLPKRE